MAPSCNKEVAPPSIPCSTKNRRQRNRMRYLLGQLQTELGQNEAAYQTFGKVASSNPPYEMEFAARLRQAEVLSSSRYPQVLKMLHRMTKSDKNKDYLVKSGRFEEAVPELQKVIGQEKNRRQRNRMRYLLGQL